MNDFKVGDKVVFIDVETHEKCPEYYPAVGTIGIVTSPIEINENLEVQWQQGSTCLDDLWWCNVNRIKLFEEIKPCPFCEKTQAESVTIKDESEDGINAIQIICDFNLGGCGSSSGFRESFEEAKKLWNRGGGTNNGFSRWGSYSSGK